MKTHNHYFSFEISWSIQLTLNLQTNFTRTLDDNESPKAGNPEGGESGQEEEVITLLFNCIFFKCQEIV